MLGAPTAPVLTDGVVTLRPHGLDDVEAVVEACRDPESARWTSVPRPYTRDDATRFVRDIVPEGWARGDHRGWAIEATDDDGVARFAGNVDVRGRAVGDVGFLLHPWARGRGLMSRAVRLAVQWSFTHDGVEIVHWRAHVGNVASLRTAWACGFSLDGTTPGLLHERGRLIDAWTAHLRFGERMEPRRPWLDVPVVEGERVRLRPVEERDLPRLAEAAADPVTQRYLAAFDLPDDAGRARAWMHRAHWRAATGATVRWVVADAGDDRFLAVQSLVDLGGPDPTMGELGWFAHPDARGRGVVSEAARLAVGHAFAPAADGGLGLRRLEVMAAASNGPSNAVIERLGFTRTGHEHRSEPLGDGSFDDLYRYELFAPGPGHSPQPSGGSTDAPGNGL